MLCDATKGAKTLNPSIKKKGRTQTLKFLKHPSMQGLKILVELMVIKVLGWILILE